MAFHVFGLRSLSFLPPDESKDFGDKELDILINKYGQEKSVYGVTSNAIVDADMVRQEWSLLKDIVVQQKYPLDSLATLSFMSQGHDHSVISQGHFSKPYRTYQRSVNHAISNG